VRMPLVASARTVDNLNGQWLGMAAAQVRALDRASSRRHSPPAVLFAAVLAESVAFELRTERFKHPQARGPDVRDRSVAKVWSIYKDQISAYLKLHCCGDFGAISA
jgi:hypothetical protein